MPNPVSHQHLLRRKVTIFLPIPGSQGIWSAYRKPINTYGTAKAKRNVSILMGFVALPKSVQSIEIISHTSHKQREIASVPFGEMSDGDGLPTIFDDNFLLFKFLLSVKRVLSEKAIANVQPTITNVLWFFFSTGEKKAPLAHTHTRFLIYGL